MKTVHLTIKVRTAATFYQRLIGLLGEKERQFDEGLLLKPCHAVHTLGMTIPLDIFFLSKNHQVVSMKTLHPGKIMISFKGSYALELPEGTIQKYSICRGDTLIWK
ncbi:DUF192 domain-containing protein [Anaeromusa acidaminophila]|uniref:DUF192 domain-containing protein n=1 Tax=Anaeromusa acidaminophila TaxID=81464 RepID=UPI00036F8D39|nr:DUF192 domain-containing protein [Anaeromusa acidaminophila]